MVRTFDDEVKALEDYGHDCCARIDDRIHECCKRIREAHEQELDNMRCAHEILMDERHKAICKLREMPELYPNKDGEADLYAWNCELANAIGADTELFSAIRDRLIHLLGGDQPTLSELFGILREGDDGVDTRPSDSASADSPVHGAAGCGCSGRCGGLAEETLAPITTELRDSMAYVTNTFSGDDEVRMDEEEFTRLCDNIDAIHAGLERENAELQKRTKYPAETQRINMLEREVKRLTSECKTQRNNFDQATSAREHWKTLYEQALEQIHDLERDYKVACDVNERQDCEYADLAKRYDKTITLPLDADGLPIHIGDVMDFTKNVCGLTVFGIGIVDASESSLGVFVREGHDYVWYNAEFLHRHVHTVEDVLTEMLAKAIERGELTNGASQTIAEYAKRLKLADA